MDMIIKNNNQKMNIILVKEIKIEAEVEVEVKIEIQIKILTIRVIKIEEKILQLLKNIQMITKIQEIKRKNID